MGCGLGTEGRGAAAASQALPTGSLVQHLRPTGSAEAGEQRAQCPGSKDAATCHWSHFLLRPCLTPAAPSCHKKTPESCCAQWFGCRLTTHLSLGLGGGAVSGGSWSPSPCAGELALGIGCNLPLAGNRMTKQNSSCCYRLPLMWRPWGLTSENTTALRPQHCPAAWRTCPRRCGTGAALTPKPQECVLRMLSEATAGVLGPQSAASGG